MSKYWRYGCIDCDVDCGYDINHGDARLRDLAVVAWPAIRKLHETIKGSEIEGWLEIEMMGYQNIVGFLETHDGHQIELRSEYGDREPLTIPAVPQ